ncbi:MAG: geranylgeranylglycerol-phosphate geranylgeranyltransferase, partial [Haloferacaceae archaeon]
PGNAVAAAALTFTGAFVAVGASVVAPGVREQVVAAVVATVAATGAGNAVNDYFDRDIDRTNRPDRPIPRGAVSPRWALAESVVLFGVAVVAALALPVLALAIAVVNLVALLAYTELFKGLPGVGNVVVAYLTGSTFLFGGAAVGAPLDAAVLAVLAGVATLTREIVKDVEDVSGDREEGLRTLPIVLGERRALGIGLAAMVVAVVASVVPFAVGTFGPAYLVVVLPADALMLHATVRSFDDPSTGQRRLKLGMFLAALAFVLGRLTVVVGTGWFPPFPTVTGTIIKKNITGSPLFPLVR